MMKKIALFWEKENEKIRCKLCPHNCLISHGKSGICKVRHNENSILYTSAYLNLCAIAVDPIEKKPLYHFLPKTKTLSIAIAGCNLSCKNCQNFHISQNTDIDGYSLSPQLVVEMSIKKQCPSISFTYSEPTIFYEYMLETAQLAKEYNLKTAIISNGYICKEPLLFLIPYIDAANIDVKAFSEETYKKLTGGSLSPVLETILLLAEHNIHIELTYLMVPEYSDNMEEIELYLNWLIDNKLQHIPLHFSRFFPKYKLAASYPTPVNHIKRAIEMAHQKGFKNVYSGNVII